MSNTTRDRAPYGAPRSMRASLADVPYTRIREIGGDRDVDGRRAPALLRRVEPPDAPFIVDAAERALATGTRSTPRTPACPSLRHAIAAQYRRLHGVELDPGSEIVVTASGVQALHLAIRVGRRSRATRRSSSPPPGRTAHRSSRSRTGVPIDVPLALAGERYRIDFAALEAAVSPRTRLILLDLAVEPARLGRRRSTSSSGCSTSAASAASGCSPTRSTSGSTTTARRSASRHPRSCGSATATTLSTSCSRSRRATA